MSPLPKGISHMMRMALLAPKFRDLDLAREPILFLLPPSRGESLIGVTTTLVTSISSAAPPLTNQLLRGGGICRYPFLIRGVTVIGVCPSHRQTSSARSSSIPAHNLVEVFLLLFWSVLNFWGMFVRVYPRIVQGLTFLNSVKHITKILYLLYKLMPLL